MFSHITISHLLHSYGNGPLISIENVVLPIKDCDFPVRELLVYQRIYIYTPSYPQDDFSMISLTSVESL